MAQSAEAEAEVEIDRLFNTARGNMKSEFEIRLARSPVFLYSLFLFNIHTACGRIAE